MGRREREGEGVGRREMVGRIERVVKEKEVGREDSEIKRGKEERHQYHKIRGAFNWRCCWKGSS